MTRVHVWGASGYAAAECIRALHHLEQVFACDFARNAVVLCQWRVQKIVISREQFSGGPVLQDDVLEERDGLIIHGRFDLLRELRVADCIDAFEFVELVEAEPLAEKFGGHPPRFPIGQHAS